MDCKEMPVGPKAVLCIWKVVTQLSSRIPEALHNWTTKHCPEGTRDLKSEGRAMLGTWTHRIHRSWGSVTVWLKFHSLLLLLRWLIVFTQPVLWQPGPRTLCKDHKSLWPNPTEIDFLCVSEWRQIWLTKVTRRQPCRKRLPKPDDLGCNWIEEVFF